MFGLFKKQDYRVDLKRDFESNVRQIRSADPMRQGLVGRGIEKAQEQFKAKYTLASFQAAPFSERQAFIAQIKQMQLAINKATGPVAILSIGYGLFNLWLVAAAMSENDLMRQFETDLNYFKRLADSLSSELKNA